MAGTVAAGGSAISALEQTYRPALKGQCNEEMRIVNDFDDGNEGVGKFGNLLNITKVPRVPATKVTASSTDGGTSLTYSNDNLLNVTVSPTFAYGAVQISRMVMSRLLRDPQLRKTYRVQIGKGLASQIDADGGALVPSLSTTVKGSGAQTFDKAFLLDGIGSLIEQARELYKPGVEGWAYLKYHPRQYKYVHAINEIINAEIRGDGEKPVRIGWVWKAYGLQLAETGSILTSAGVAHNLLHIRDSHVIAYNTEVDFLTPQEFELVWRLIAFVEYGVGEVWDEYAADMQTAA